MCTCGHGCTEAPPVAYAECAEALAAPEPEPEPIVTDFWVHDDTGRRVRVMGQPRAFSQQETFPYGEWKGATRTTDEWMVPIQHEHPHYYFSGAAPIELITRTELHHDYSPLTFPAMA